jgi:hypothetical protein
MSKVVFDILDIPGSSQRNVDKTLHVATNSKYAVFLADGETLMTDFDINTYKTANFPVSLGSRTVRGFKDRRAISAEPLGAQIMEYPVASAFRAHMVTAEQPGIFGSKDNYPFAHATGNHYRDHRNLAQATSDPDIRIATDDASAFDGSVGKECWLGISNAVMDFSKVIDEYSPQYRMGLIYACGKLWSKNIDAHYKVGGRVLQRTVMPSGSQATINLDTFVNEAVYQLFLEKFKEESEAGRINGLVPVYASFQGDDNITFWRTSTATTEDIKRLLELRATCAANTGFAMNKVKSGMSKIIAEYLKAQFIAGQYLGRYPQVNPNSNERGYIYMLPCPRMQAIKAYLATGVYRGWSHDANFRLTLAMWNIIRFSERKVEKGTVWTSLPFYCMFVPVSQGGVGCFPHTIMGSSVDTPIQIHALRHPTFKTLLEDAIPYADIKPVRFIQGLKRSISARKFDPPGVFDKGINFINSVKNPKKVVAAQHAAEFLRSIGFKPRRTYADSANFEVTEMVQTSAAKAAQAANADISFTIIQVAKSHKPGRLAVQPWIDTEAFNFTEIQPRKIAEHTPFPTAFALRHVYNHFGFSTSDSLINVTGALMKIVRGKIMPGITEEDAVAMLTNPKIVYTDGAMYNLFIAWGADPAHASQMEAAIKTLMQTKGLDVYIQSQAYSFGDEFLPTVQHDMYKLDDLLEGYTQISKSSFRDMIYYCVLLYEILMSIEGTYLKSTMTNPLKFLQENYHILTSQKLSEMPMQYRHVVMREAH